MRRCLTPAIVLAFALPATAGAAPGGGDARGVLVRVQGEVVNLENSLAVNRADVGNLIAQVRYFPLERRLVDADLFFETKDYEKAATLYRDLVDNPSYAGGPGYYKAVFKLGESLYRMRNYQSARKYFRQAAVPAAGTEFAPAVGRLFDVAVQTRDFAECERYEGLMAGLTAPEALYSYGKYLYHRDRRPQAREVFNRVAHGTPPYGRAQYFVGVIDALAKRFDTALNAFGLASGQAPAPGDEGDVRSTAILASARVLYEVGRAQEALGLIQQVDVRSPAFLDALYDSAWIYLKLGDLKRAAHALDILLMTSPSGETALKAGALRGRILSRLNDSQAATEAYQEVSAALGPVTAELDRIGSDPDALGRYFQWVIERDSTTFALDLPISERTQRWLESDPEMAGVVGIFRDLSREREDARQSFEMVERLLWALKSGGKLEAFPSLKDKFLRLKDLEAQFVGAATRAAEVAEGAVGPAIPGDLRARYEAAVAARRAAVSRLKDAPKRYDEYVGRERKTTVRYKDLEKDLFLAESVLRMQRQQILAIEEWLKEERYREVGTPLSAEREKAIRADLDAVKASLAELHQESLRIRESLERDTVVNAAVNDAIRDEDATRRDLLAALGAEVDLLVAATPALPADGQDLARAAVAVVQKAMLGASAVGPILASLLDVADRGAAEYVGIVEREKARLETQMADLQKAELDSRQFAQTEGAAVFRGVRARLGDVLLEADLGLVDMAWQREQAVAEKLREIGLEKTDKMKAVEEMSETLKQMSSEPAPAEGGGEAK